MGTRDPRAIDVLENSRSYPSASPRCYSPRGDIHQPLHTVSGYYNLTDPEHPQLFPILSRVGKPQTAEEISFLYKESGTPFSHPAGRESCDVNVFRTTCQETKGSCSAGAYFQELSRMADKV